MYHSFKSLEEFRGVDPKRRTLILMACGMRQWKSRKTWRNYLNSFIFIGLFPVLISFVVSFFEPSETISNATWIISFIVGYKIAIHRHIAGFIPEIKECLEHGLTLEEIDQINKNKRINPKRLILGAGYLFIFCIAITKFVIPLGFGVKFNWSEVILISIGFSSLISLAIYAGIVRATNYVDTI